MENLKKTTKEEAIKIALKKINYKTIIINNFKVGTCGFFAYDGCHKIYILENAKNIEDAINLNYNILKIEKLEEVYNSSCDLKFINSWDLSTTFVPQFEEKVIVKMEK